MGTYNQELASTSYQSLNNDTDKLKKITSGVDKWYSYFSTNNENWINDSNFALGDQWNYSEQSEYQLRTKVLLTVNVLYSYILNIVGEQRQNSPQIAVRAKRTDISQSSVNTIEGILREISYSSESDLAYQLAFMNALMGGYGVWRIVVDYENPRTFDKTIKIVHSFDPLKHYFDTDATHPTKCDGQYAGTYSVVNREEFKVIYGIDAPTSVTTPQESGFYWSNEDGIIICEDFRKIYKKTKLYKLSNGVEVEADKLDETMRELKDQQERFEGKVMSLYSGMLIKGINIPPPPPIDKIKIVDERDTELTSIRQTKFIKDQILEEEDWYGENLPVIFEDGDSHYCNGYQETRSFIRYSRDPQRFLNFCVSEIAQTLKTSNKTQFMYTHENIKGYEKYWSNPERSISGLPFNPDPRTQGGAPIKLPPPEVSSSLFTSVQSVLGMIDNTLGRYEANKGQQGNEQSGKAIANRAKQGNKSVFIFLDNLNKAIEQTNKICLNIIPEVYGENEKTVYITDKEGRKTSQKVNTSEEDKLRSDGMEVIVTIGPSFEMQKIDAFNQMLQLVSLNPQQFTVLLADLMAANLSVDNTNQIVERMKNFVVPPAVTAKEEGKPPPKPQPNPQIEIAQMQAKAQMLKSVADVEKATNDIKTAQTKTDAEIEKAKIGLASDIVKALGDIRSQQIKNNSEIAAMNSENLNNVLDQTSKFISETL